MPAAGHARDADGDEAGLLVGGLAGQRIGQHLRLAPPDRGHAVPPAPAGDDMTW
jgi:hypothetical protein